MIRVPLRKLAEQGHDIEEIRRFFKTFHAGVNHLYWCKRLGIDPDPKVIERAMQLKSYWRIPLLDERSPLYIFKGIERVPRPKKSFIKLNPVTSLYIVPLQRDSFCSLDLVSGKLRIRGVCSRTIELQLNDRIMDWILDRLAEHPDASKYVRLTLDERYLNIHLCFRATVDVPDVKLPLEGDRLVAIVDINSRYGIAVTYILIRNSSYRIVRFQRFRRKNFGYLWKRIKRWMRIYSILRNQGIRNEEARKWWRRARQLLRKIGRINRQFMNDVSSEIVKRVRRLAKRYGVEPLIVVDTPYNESLRGSILQQTLRGFAKALRNKAHWYGIPCIEVQLSSTLCSFCNEKMKLVRRTKRLRIYRCPKCGFEADRDLVPAYTFLMHYITTKIRHPQQDHQHKASIH